jgi:hypothetical protein
LPCDRAQALREFYSTISDPELFDNPGTPQSLALDWITNHDSMMVCPNNSTCHAVQRYVMAVLYFSLKGYQWSECSAAKDWYCDEEATLADANCNIGSNYSKPWLSSSHECHWGGCGCHGEDEPEITWCMDQIELQAINAKGIIPREITSLEHLRFLLVDQDDVSSSIPSAKGSIQKLEINDLE